MKSFWMVVTVPSYRQLFIELTRRELIQRYKQSVLGFMWVIINPLAQMLVMSLVFSFVFRSSDIGVPYPVFLFMGLLPWNLFAQSLTAATLSLTSNNGLLAKIYFPREILVLSSMAAKLVDFLFSVGILVVMMIIFQIAPTFNVLWFIPILAIQLLFTYGLGLLMAAFNLFYRDIQYLINLILMLWMYLTPVMYSVNIFPEKWQWIFKINPMAVLINAYREVVLGGGVPNYGSLLLSAAVAVIFAVGGFMIFKKLEGQFADAV